MGLLDKKLSANGRAFVENEEGYVRDAYLLEGLPHIGMGQREYYTRAVINRFGRSDVRIGDSLTDEELDEETKAVIVSFENFVNVKVSAILNQNQFDALFSFCYNVGKNAFANSTLLKYLNNSDYSGAASQFGRWVYSAGKKNPVLIARRERERQLFLKDSSLPKSNLLPVLALAFIVAVVGFSKSNQNES